MVLLIDANKDSPCLGSVLPKCSTNALTPVELAYIEPLSYRPIYRKRCAAVLHVPLVITMEDAQSYAVGFYTVGQKTAPLYFCNNFIKTF